jgi:hypothetical protein
MSDERDHQLLRVSMSRDKRFFGTFNARLKRWLKNARRCYGLRVELLAEQNDGKHHEQEQTKQ